MTFFYHISLVFMLKSYLYIFYLSLKLKYTYTVVFADMFLFVLFGKIALPVQGL